MEGTSDLSCHADQTSGRQTVITGGGKVARMQFTTKADHGGAGRVRDEDAFDVEAVAAWLSDQALIGD